MKRYLLHIGFTIVSPFCNQPRVVWKSNVRTAHPRLSQGGDAAATDVREVLFDYLCVFVESEDVDSGARELGVGNGELGVDFPAEEQAAYDVEGLEDAVARDNENHISTCLKAMFVNSVIF